MKCAIILRGFQGFDGGTKPKIKNSLKMCVFVIVQYTIQLENGQPLYMVSSPKHKFLDRISVQL